MNINRAKLTDTFDGDRYIYIGDTENGDALWLMEDIDGVENEDEVLMVFTFSDKYTPNRSKKCTFYDYLYNLDFSKIKFIKEESREEVTLLTNNINYFLSSHKSDFTRNSIVNDLSSYITSSFM